MSEKETAFGKVALPVISNEHNMIHGGEMFTAQVANAALGASAVLLIEINVPANYGVHLKSTTFYNGADLEYELIEAPTLTTGGAALTAYNRNRVSVKTSGLILKSNPTGISGGTLLDNVFIKGTVQSPGIIIISDWEWMLKEGVYLLRLTNNGVGSEQALLKANWYEHVET